MEITMVMLIALHAIGGWDQLLRTTPPAMATVGVMWTLLVVPTTTMAAVPVGSLRLSRYNL